MSPELLAGLKKLQYERSDPSPFDSHVEFLQWSDNVAPRLSFDKNIKESFQRHISIAKSQRARRCPNTSEINEAIGVLNQAVLLLETDQLQQGQALAQEPIQAPLDPPPKITVKWLYEHGSLSLSASGLAVIVSAFLAGLAFSETQLYALIKAPTATAKQSTNNPNAKAIDSATPQVILAPKK